MNISYRASLSVPACFLALALSSNSALAADYSDDVRKNDYKWVQLNWMYSYKELPRPDGASTGHDYLEMEFGGRSGIFHLYGYVDVFNLSNSKSSDKYETEKMFMKLAPRFSLDGLFRKDLSFGPVHELYIATLFNWGGGYTKNSDFESVNNSFWGVGSDISFPWLGTIGLNLYGLYDLNKKKWNGYQVSTNWFKSLYTFENKSFIAYQGYIDYQFGVDKVYDTNNVQTGVSDGGVMFNGLYWHSEHFSVGYGLKLYKDVYGLKDRDRFKTSGTSHYLSVTYKL